jgi:PAS domain S-box-containing protein
VNYHEMTKAELVEEIEALNATVNYFVFDRNGVVRSANAGAVALLGLDRRTVVGKPFNRFVDESDAEAFAAHIRSACESEGRVATDIRLRSSGGVRHTRLETLRADGGERGILLRTVVLDVTERKQLEDQLLHAQRMEAIGRLAGGIAHDFNNMLMAILGHTELLLMRLGHGDPLRGSITTIQETAERAAALTRQLVTFSRKQIVTPRVLNLNAIVTDMKKMLRRLIGEDVELVCALDAELGKLKIDTSQAEQVVMNLAVNARDAMPSGGRLMIRTANATVDAERARRRVDVRPGDYVELSVSDTGIGIEEETLAHIFEPFFTTKVQGKGTGLGLSTVYAIVQQNGGHIEVESEPGRGTTFTIRFPRVEGEVAEVRPVVREEMPRGTETVLVVEDDDAVRDLVCQMLRMVGYAVLEARHGGEALLICEQSREHIHLMVTDVVMPQMSGRQLAERLAPLQPDMKVVFMSGHTDDAVIRHGVRNAMMTFIQKPFTPAALAKKVRAVLVSSEV